MMEWIEVVGTKQGVRLDDCRERPLQKRTHILSESDYPLFTRRFECFSAAADGWALPPPRIKSKPAKLSVTVYLVVDVTTGAFRIICITLAVSGSQYWAV